MKAPETIHAAWFAPCGINCLLCYRHLGKKPCPGCRPEASGKPEHCRRCKIKVCAAAQGIASCFQCAHFPCKQVKALDKSYRTRYGVSLVESGKQAQALGIEAFLISQTAQYTCPTCKGLISLHEGDCSECGGTYPLGRRSVPK